MGDFVSVCFNIRPVERLVLVGSQERVLMVPERSQHGWIDFTVVDYIIERGARVYHVKAGSTIEGGLNAIDAERVAAELFKAVAYLKEFRGADVTA